MWNQKDKREMIRLCGGGKCAVVKLRPRWLKRKECLESKTLMQEKSKNVKENVEIQVSWTLLNGNHGDWGWNTRVRGCLDQKRWLTVKGREVRQEMLKQPFQQKRGNGGLPPVFKKREKSLRELTEDLIGKRFEVKNVIGRGRFGLIRLGVDHEDQERHVALKCMNKSTDPKVTETEVRVLKRLMTLSDENEKYRKQFTVPIEIIERGESIIVALEYLWGGDLFDRIMLKGYVDEANLKPIIKSVVDSIVTLHRMGIIHRDIKPENILFRVTDHISDDQHPRKIDHDAQLPWANLEPVLCDFGLSYVLGEQDLIDPPAGTFGYASPDILNSDYRVTPACDVWSLGVLIYACLAGELPFSASTDGKTTLQQHLSEAYRGPQYTSQRWDEVSSEAKDLISQMLHYASYNRITMEEASMHPWFQKP